MCPSGAFLMPVLDCGIPEQLRGKEEKKKNKLMTTWILLKNYSRNLELISDEKHCVICQGN